MLNHTPYPLVIHANVLGTGFDRHLPHQRQQCLLEQQSEFTVLSCPRNFYTMNAVFFTTRTGYFCLDIAMVLKEVQMLPGKLFEVVSLTRFIALRTKVKAASLSTYIKRQVVGFLGCIEVLINYRAIVSEAQKYH